MSPSGAQLTCPTRPIISLRASVGYHPFLLQELSILTGNGIVRPTFGQACRPSTFGFVETFYTNPFSAFHSPLESRLIHPALLQHPKSSWNLRSWSAHRRTPLRRNGGRSGASRMNMSKDIASPPRHLSDLCALKNLGGRRDRPVPTSSGRFRPGRKGSWQHSSAPQSMG